MRTKVTSLTERTGVVAFYMGGDISAAESDLALRLLGAGVFRGERQCKQARAAAARGALVWLDPADCERSHRRGGELTLLPSEPWFDEQQRAGVAELISPGVAVAERDPSSLDDRVAEPSISADRLNTAAKRA